MHLLALLNLLPQLVLDQEGRSGDLAHLDKPVELVDPVDGRLFAKVL